MEETFWSRIFRTSCSEYVFQNEFRTSLLEWAFFFHNGGVVQ